MRTKIKITKNLFKRLNKLDIGSSYEREFLDKFEGKTIIFTKEEFTRFIENSNFEGIGCGQKNSIAGNILYYYLLLYMGKEKAEDFSRGFAWVVTKTEVLIDYVFQLIEEERKKCSK